MSERKIQKFDIAYSLGCTCAPALYMRSLMMRFASGPFDWLAGGNFETRIHAIETDFCDFMREQDLELRERDFGFGLTFAHDYYHNVHNDLRHYHDFKTGVPLVETYPAVMEKYQRRMKRFAQLRLNWVPRSLPISRIMSSLRLKKLIYSKRYTRFLHVEEGGCSSS